MDQMPEPDNALPPARSPDCDLALAFLGSITVGLVIPVILFLLFQWRPGLLLGGFAGFLWGYLTVIVAAAARGETRRSATFWMFAVLSVGVWIICWLLRGAVADV